MAFTQCDQECELASWLENLTFYFYEVHPTHFLYRRMAITMQMMKTTARTGPTTQIRPSPASNGCGSESGAITRSVYGLATYIFCKKKRKQKNTTEEDDHKIVDRQWQKRAFYFFVFYFGLPWTPETKFQFDALSISVDYCSRCGLGSPGKLERTWKPEPGVSSQQIPTFFRLSEIFTPMHLCLICAIQNTASHPSCSRSENTDDKTGYF